MIAPTPFLNRRPAIRTRLHHASKRLLIVPALHPRIPIPLPGPPCIVLRARHPLMPRHAMHEASPEPTVPTHNNRLRRTVGVQLATVTGRRLAGAELGQGFQEADEFELVVGGQGGAGSGVQLDEGAVPGGVADGAADSRDGLVGDGGLQGGAQAGAAYVAAVRVAGEGDVDWEGDVGGGQVGGADVAGLGV